MLTPKYIKPILSPILPKLIEYKSRFSASDDTCIPSLKGFYLCLIRQTFET